MCPDARSTRSSRFATGRRHRLAPLPAIVGIVAAFAASPAALAAADDQSDLASPVAAPAGLAAPRPPAGDPTDAPPAVGPSEAEAEAVAGRARPATWRTRLGTPYVGRGAVAARAPSDASAGAPDLLDLSLGARWRVVHGDPASHVPVAAWMPDLQSADTRLAAPRGQTNLSGEWALPNDFSVGVMPGLTTDYSADGRRLATGTIAVTLGKAWTPQWRTFVDMARERLATLQLSGAPTSVDAGVSFVAAPGTQIDFAVTRGLGDAAPPLQAGLGVSSSF